MKKTAFFLCLLSASWCRAQPCTPYWTSVRGALPVVPSFTLIDSVVALDDGGGPALFIGGDTDPNVFATYGVWRWREGQMIQLPGLPPMPPFGNRRGPFILDNGDGPRVAVWMRGDTIPLAWTLYWWDGTTFAPDSLIANQTNVLIYASYDDGSGSRIVGTRAFSTSDNHVVRWNGSGWTNLGGNFDTGMRPVVVDLGAGPELYAVGQLESIGGQPTGSTVVRWNGLTWLPVGAMTQYVHTLAAYDDGSGLKLYALSNCCDYQIMLFRLEVSTWVPLGSPWAPPQTLYNMVDLVPFEDAPGQWGLYIVGSFVNLSPTVVSRGIARFDGSTWNPVGLGTGESGVRGVAVMQDSLGPSLFITGAFTTMGGGGQVSRGLAQLVGCPNCYANCDTSTQPPRLNVADFTCFLRKFAARDAYSNCNMDPAIDIADFACFLQKFTAGCN